GPPAPRYPPRLATVDVHQYLYHPPQWFRGRHGAPASLSALGHHPYRVLQTGEGSLPPPLGGSTHHPLRGRSSSGVSPRFPLVRQQGTDRPPDRQRRPGRVGPGLGRRGVRLPEDHREPLARRSVRARATCSAASSMSWCSQKRSTTQPAFLNRASVYRSRATFPSSLRSHHVLLLAGSVACTGQRCQKLPSTNTATRSRTKVTSARLRGMPSRGRS